MRARLMYSAGSITKLHASHGRYTHFEIFEVGKTEPVIASARCAARREHEGTGPYHAAELMTQLRARWCNIAPLI
jgi:hypothetical protein